MKNKEVAEQLSQNADAMIREGKRLQEEIYADVLKVIRQKGIRYEYCNEWN